MEKLEIILAVFGVLFLIIGYFLFRRKIFQIESQADEERIQALHRIAEERRRRNLEPNISRRERREEETGTEHELRIRNCICVIKFEEGDDPRVLTSAPKQPSTLVTDQHSYNSNIFTHVWQSVRSQVFDSTRDSSRSKPECSICLESYEVGENMAWPKTDKCNHIFHEDCIKLWLKDHNECPLCRADMLDFTYFNGQ